MSGRLILQILVAPGTVLQGRQPEGRIVSAVSEHSPMSSVELARPSIRVRFGSLARCRTQDREERSAGNRTNRARPTLRPVGCRGIVPGNQRSGEPRRIPDMLHPNLGDR